MARGTSLQEMVTMVREEAGHSTSAALGQNTVDGLKHKIRRQQEILWLENEWPHLRVHREIELQAGSRYYNPPADLSMNHRIDLVEVRYDEEWRLVEHGITADHYNYLDPEKDDRDDPVRSWQVYEAEQLEFWPIPATNGIRIRLRGTRNLRPLIANDDVCDLDDQMIVLFVASELCAKQNQRDADSKLALARNLLNRLKGVQSKDRAFKMGKRDAMAPSYMHRTAIRWGRKL
jgi:hypothetical protein